MARIETVNQAQAEMVGRFIKAYGSLHGELVEGVSIVSKKNHRYYLSFEGDESPIEYGVVAFTEYVNELEAEAAINGGVYEPRAGTREEVEDEEEQQGSDVADGASAASPTEPGDEQRDDELVQPVDEETGELELTDEERAELLAAFSQGIEQGGMTSGLQSVISDMLYHSDQGTRGRLAIGADLADLERTAKEEGLKPKEAVDVAQTFFEARGRKFPSETQRSRCRTAAKAWLNTGPDSTVDYDLDTSLTSELYVDDLGAPRTTTPDGDKLVPLGISSLDVDTLWTLRHLVSGDPTSDAHVLALGSMFSLKTIKKIGRFLTPGNFESQLREWAALGNVGAEDAATVWGDAQRQTEVSTPEFKSISGISAPLVDRYKGTLTKAMTELATEAGVFEPRDEGEQVVSKTFVLEILFAFWDSLDARQRLLMIKSQYGVISEDEYKELFGNPA